MRPTPETEPAEDVETRQRILDAAHRVFLQKGTAAARTQEIAHEAGVNKALLHYYFGTKHALADAVFAREIGTLFPRLMRILADEALPIPDKVRRAVNEQIDFHSAHPYLAGYLAAELHTDPKRLDRLLPPGARPPLHVLARQLGEAADAGTMRRIPVEQFVATLMGAIMLPFLVRPLVETLLDLRGDRFTAFIDARREILPDLIIAGLRP